MRYKEVFKTPKPMKITGRTSTITNSFVTSIIPSIEPTEEEIKECLEILGLDPNDLCCAYCGDKATEWDHLRPLVKDKKPTGYISEIRNLVP
ncbi:MAG: HNH endonuclease, partial [Dehalococcoidia bacterium]